MNDSDVSSTESVTCLRTRPTRAATATPTARPPSAERANCPATPPTLTVPAMAAMAVRRQTRAVASLTSDSPSRTVTTRRGSPIRRAIVVAATASGGATTAPSANAAANGTGSSSQVTRPTPRAVNTTRPTERNPIARRLSRKSTSEQRGQQPDEDHLRAQVHLREERQVRRADAYQRQDQRRRDGVPAGQSGDKG